MKRSHAFRLMAVGLVIFAGAVEFYSVRELVAALVLFSLLFSIVVTGSLTLIATEESALKGMSLLGSRVAE